MLKIKYIESLNKYNESEMQIFNKNFVKSRYFYIFIINLAKISKKDYIFGYAKLYELKNEKKCKIFNYRNIILILT